MQITELISKFILGFAIGMAFAAIYENLPFQELFHKKALTIFGYKLHHSLYGIIVIIFALFSGDISSKILLVSAGIGIILQHYLTGGGLVFVTKETKDQ